MARLSKSLSSPAFSHPRGSGGAFSPAPHSHPAAHTSSCTSLSAQRNYSLQSPLGAGLSTRREPLAAHTFACRHMQQEESHADGRDPYRRLNPYRRLTWRRHVSQVGRGERCRRPMGRRDGARGLRAWRRDTPAVQGAALDRRVGMGCKSAGEQVHVGGEITPAQQRRI